MPQHSHAQNGATPPPGDAAADLAALRVLIEETRRDINARLDALAQTVDRLLPTAAPPPSMVTPEPTAQRPMIRDVKVGDEVYVPKLGGTHTVVEVSDSGQVLKVQAGLMRVRVRRDELWSLDADEAAPPSKRATAGSPARPELNANIPEIDLHGYSEADAIVTLELFLHHAVAQRTPRVRIIHGKGNGTLRAAVRRELKRSPLVRAVEIGPQFQGDDGVTLAELYL